MCARSPTNAEFGSAIQRHGSSSIMAVFQNSSFISSSCLRRDHSESGAGAGQALSRSSRSLERGQVTLSSDSDQSEARVTRETVFTKIAEEAGLVGTAHLPGREPHSIMWERH
ncbi:hypothetical protein AGR4C_pa60055 [Agrobacterium tumefaciens str. Kerr 14]|uniref:Uncharacterized protein n=1 Tax=Agrobacterium tumefaciens str. Kerr 14 TaxID=1183424 RepID=A0A1S7SBQ2_AGRTU|nr:hypothetical protein AGR4C_pa60055 [Agrobacterium tumefaciens str. Kerr 14]